MKDIGTLKKPMKPYQMKLGNKKRHSMKLTKPVRVMPPGQKIAEKLMESSLDFLMVHSSNTAVFCGIRTVEGAAGNAASRAGARQQAGYAQGRTPELAGTSGLECAALPGFSGKQAFIGTGILRLPAACIRWSARDGQRRWCSHALHREWARR
jgi:hypothetical protein